MIVNNNKNNMINTNIATNNTLSFNKENIINNIIEINNVFQTHYNEHKDTIVTIYNTGFYPPSPDFYRMAKLEFRFPIQGFGDGCLAHCPDDDIYYDLPTEKNEWINDLYEMLAYYIDFSNPENQAHDFSLDKTKEIIELPVSAVIEFLNFVTGEKLE